MKFFKIFSCQMAFECQRVAKINCDLTKSDMNYGNSKFSIYCHSTYKKYGDLQVDFLGF